MPRVLVIEDDVVLRGNLLDLLDAEGYDVSVVADGIAGITQAHAWLPDLVLCDIMMPALDGYGVLSELRRSPATATIPFVFLTARTEKRDLREGMSLGADDYVTKPFTSTELLRAMQARLSQRAKLNREFEKRLSDLRDNLALALPHEFRTPLNGILGASELLIETCQGSAQEELRELAELIHRSGQRLHRLVNNYLLYVEIETTLRDPARITTWRGSRVLAAGKLVTEVSQAVAAQAKRDADLHMAVVDVSIVIHEDHFRRLIAELLDNACKYSPPGTPIEVRAGAKDSRFVLSVSDCGRGMNTQQLASVGAFMQSVHVQLPIFVKEPVSLKQV